MTTPRPGRRIAEALPTGRLTPAVAVAAAAPVVTLIALLLQAPAADQQDPGTHAPASKPLTSQHIGCPATPAGGALVAASAAGKEAGGTVTVAASGGGQVPVPLMGGGTARPAAPGAVVLAGQGGLAAGLYAARLGQGAAAECSPPLGEYWFVGAGSGAEHLTQLTLTNPDAGAAVADVVLWGSDGPLESSRTRGLTVPGGHSQVVDLESEAPHRNEVAVQVLVTRGRVVTAASDSWGTGLPAPSRDLLPASDAPAERLVVPGLSRVADQRSLTVVNPGANLVRVTVQVVGARSTFAPAGLAEISVPAGRALATDLTRALAGIGAEDSALLLTATGPVTAGLRSVSGGDLVHHPALQPAEGATAVVVPNGRERTLLLTAAGEEGTVEVAFVGGAGGTQEVRLRPGTTTAVPVPAGVVAVTARSTVPYTGAVRALVPGVTGLPLRPLVTEQLVPAVRPAWPPTRN